MKSVGPILIIAAAGMIFLTNCSSQATGSTPSSPNTSNPPVTTPGALTPGRLLASQCAQCHGTDGVSSTNVEGLAGEASGEILEEMREMQAENKNDLMTVQAHGYNDEQLQHIADYFASITGAPSEGSEEED